MMSTAFPERLVRPAQPLQLQGHAIDTPIGDMLLVTDEQARVRGLDFADHPARLQSRLGLHCGPHHLQPGRARHEAALRLQAYFEGDIHALAGLTLLTRGNALQEQVWTALCRVPAGRVISDESLTRQLGHTAPGMVQAVRAACASNPVALLVPCHRMIGRGGQLQGLAWGPTRQRWLLIHESAQWEPEPGRA